MNIIHDEQNQRFETVIDDLTAYLSYEIIADDTLDYNHTIVPSALGGRGIGKALASEALAYADKHGKKVRPSCSFVASFINKNPQYAHLQA